MEKDTSELEKRDSPVSKGKDTLELEKANISESEKKSERESSSLKLKDAKNISEIEKEETASDSKKQTESDNTHASVLKRKENVSSELEERTVTISSKLEEDNQNGDLELEDKAEEDVLELEDKLIEGKLELEDESAEGKLKSEEQSEGNLAEADNVLSEKDKETEVPLLIGESVSINMQGESSTVHVHSKGSAEGKSKKRESPFLTPIRRLRKAWDKSTNVCDFVLRAALIIFSTLGWILCIGGIPFVSIAMFIIGSVYIDDCKVQPNIPVYLIVGGVFGTIQHFIAFWNKCLPEETQGRLSAYRTYYSAIDGAMTLFLLIWFIVGCVWVYSVGEVDFVDPAKDEFCNKTLYYFSFWLLNFSFVLIAAVVVSCLGLLLFMIAAPKKEAVV